MLEASRWRLSSFRPLAGITVFRTCTLGIFLTAVYLEFPSPGGDYGLSDLSRHPPVSGCRGRFPSPGGDYGLSDTCPSVRVLVLPECFRPLAGITVFRTDELLCELFGDIEVSVPWRGLRSFGPELVDCVRPGLYVFPSPGGDYGLSDFLVRSRARS